MQKTSIAVIDRDTGRSKGFARTGYPGGGLLWPGPGHFRKLLDRGQAGDNVGLLLRQGKIKFFNDPKGFGLTRLLESIRDESKGFSSLIR